MAHLVQQVGGFDRGLQRFANPRGDLPGHFECRAGGPLEMLEYAALPHAGFILGAARLTANQGAVPEEGNGRLAILARGEKHPGQVRRRVATVESGARHL